MHNFSLLYWSQVKHAVGLLNVNAVCLQFPRTVGAPTREVSALSSLFCIEFLQSFNDSRCLKQKI